MRTLDSKFLRNAGRSSWRLAMASEAVGTLKYTVGRDLAQVAQGLADQRWRGLAVVDVHRAAVVDHHAEVVVATEGVVPGQPVTSTGGPR